MNALLLAVTLVLHSGDRIAIEGAVREVNDAVVFRSGGLLYSVPVAEVLRVEEGGPAPKEEPKRRLRVSEEKLKQLIADLEKNHAGAGAPVPPPPTAKPLPKEPQPSPQDEALWRSQARAHEENIRRTREELTLLESRIEELQAEINSLFTLGFTARDFTYQTTQLARTRERLPWARLEVTRAERAWQQFREDARRAGVMPGWLR